MGQKAQKLEKKCDFFSIFATKWGYFGIAGGKKALKRTTLPLRNKGMVEDIILEGLTNPIFDRQYFESVQRRLMDYFANGLSDSFGDVPILLDGMTDFSRGVLAACREIGCGRTVSYGQLALMAGRAKAVRAVGSVMARNPLPLIVPCHRVVRADGNIGGFSAVGGKTVKAKLIEHERRMIQVE